jgi:hypothetical protein
MENLPVNLINSITNNYNINPVINVTKTTNGSGKTFCIETHEDKYIAKTTERLDFISLYDRIQPILSEKGFIQSKIIRTKTDELMTPEFIVLYSFLPGENYKKLNERQIINAVHYMRDYNSALSAVSFLPAEIKNENHWDKAKSIAFLVNDFKYAHLDLERNDDEGLNEAIQILRENLSLLGDAKKQLVHSDLGADNFMFQGDNVFSIIDFTPEYENEIYALCQFCYWVYFWPETNNPVLLDNWLEIYHQKSVSKYERKLFYTLLIKASLFRAAGVLLSENEINFQSLNKRITILKNAILLYKRNLKS